MRTEAGRVIRIAEENQPVPGCTVSEQIFQDDEKSFSVFSMAGGTSISAEIYTYHKLLTVYSGSMDVFTSDGMSRRVNAGESLISPTNVPVGMKTDTGCVYTETGFPKETTMNQILRAGDVFKLKDLLPYQEGRIVNMDLIHEKNLKFVIMSFDEGTGLSEHAAPRIKDDTGTVHFLPLNTDNTDQDGGIQGYLYILPKAPGLQTGLNS